MKQHQSSKLQRVFFLDVARVLAIISITLNHAVNRTYHNSNGQSSEFFAIPIASTVFKTLMMVFSRVGVPLFLMITGVLILNKKMENGSDVKRFYKRNLLSLFITTEIWYCLMYWYLLLFAPYSILQTRNWGSAIAGMFETMLFQNQVAFGSMWYMPMILCLYLFLPFVTMAKDKLAGSKEKALYLPAVLIFTVSMLLPFVNDLLKLLGQERYSSAISTEYLPVYYYLYVLIGYLVSRGVLEKFRTGTVAAVAAISFLVCCGFQFWAYARPVDYLMDYNFPLLPVVAGFLFELLRRTADRFRRMEKPITGLAKIAFGIYFLHIVIMKALVTILEHWQIIMPLPIRLLALEVLSVGLSIVMIMPLSKIKLFRKYLFLIK